MTIGNFLLKFSIFLLFLSISFYYIPTNLLKDLLKVAYQKTTYYEQQAQTEPILKHEDKIAKPQILPAPRKIIAIADLHGDYQNTIKTFKMAGLINAQLEWNAGSSIFVQTGDIVDRGDDTIKLYQLMIRLRKEAQEAGGLLVPLLGNHEVMNMQEDFRYVTQGDIDSFGGMENRIKVWSKEGWIGSYLRTLGVAALVNDTVFFHGGANTKWSKKTVDGMNKISKQALDSLSPHQLGQVGLFGNDGPLWYRGYAQDDEKEVCPLLDKALKYLNATRMVVGHTPQMSGKVLRRCGGKVFVIDVGISRVYGGHSAALEIDGDKVFGLYPKGKRIPY